MSAQIYIVRENWPRKQWDNNLFEDGKYLTAVDLLFMVLAARSPVNLSFVSH